MLGGYQRTFKKYEDLGMRQKLAEQWNALMNMDKGVLIISGMPEGGVRLMTGSTCLNQAFRFGKTAYGFQCHWEVSMDLARDWVENFGHVLQNKTVGEGFDQAGSGVPMLIERANRTLDELARG